MDAINESGDKAATPAGGVDEAREQAIREEEEQEDEEEDTPSPAGGKDAAKEVADQGGQDGMRN